ncbi:LytTR family DNA-binding domain-containing protein [Aliikangiella sp. G2MR2-5]|uniref:LytR/AlgR family response regulator transcription factor n=1 Tax=Aliikangiella sp. G2MR2-5 TaxID=2788943 RepID=UPI0018A9DBC2|nr:LytTR family DNA-binding domain-containing protein [Aliikangiella sp. G2MR2-5]
MSSSDKMTKSAMSVWQFALLITTAYVVGMFITHRTTVLETIYWSGYELEVQNDEGAWVDGNRFQIGTHEKVQRVRFNLQIDDSEKWKSPISLMVGGPFSAEIFWDGEKIGNKGEVGNSIEEETAGPIDFSSFVPSRLLSPGAHQIELHISTRHLLVRDDSVLHFVWVAPYRQDGQRDLRYYAVPLLILSGLIALSLQSFRIGRSAGNSLHTGLGLFGFCIVITLMSEVSRAVINYPYHYHELRGLLAWFGNLGAGFALIYTCYRLNDSRFSKIILALGIGVVIASYFIPMNSGDQRLAQDFTLLTLAPTLVFVVLLIKKRISYFSTLPIFWLACITSQKLSTGLFLDSFQFIASLILIGGAWVWTYVDTSAYSGTLPFNGNRQAENREQSKNQVPAEQEGASHFIIRSGGEEKKIPVSDCYALKGEGNFTAVLLLDGQSVLHQDGLGTIMKTEPRNFIRIHKSYAVNLGAVVSLKSAEGSKYWLQMSNNETIPVSRYRVAELRGLLKTRDLANTTKA